MLVLASVSAAGAAGPGDALRQQVTSLTARTQSALLDLYAIDTRLHTAQTRLSALKAESVRLRDEQLLLEQQIAATRRTLGISRKALGNNLRMLYKQGDVSALAVVLGAQSLDDAVTRLDALSSVADQSRRVVQAATQTIATQPNAHCIIIDPTNKYALYNLGLIAQTKADLSPPTLPAFKPMWRNSSPRAVPKSDWRA